MLAVSLQPGKIEVVELPRPQIEQSTDAIVMVTTTAIGHWEIDQAIGPGAMNTPGAQFAGIVVETGESVSGFNLDDLVVATCTGTLSDGRKARFGRGSLPGGHAEYVRVPLADEVLVKTTPAAEERTVFAGGEVAMGIRAADKALEAAGDGPILVSGCDATLISAIARIRQKRGRHMNVKVKSDKTAWIAAAKSLGATEIENYEAMIDGTAAIITNRFTMITPGGIPAFWTNNNCAWESDDWPSLEETRRAEMATRLRQIDLTSLVSTVLPLDEAVEAYRVAIKQPPGVRAVLMKP